ncbi:hypothetical protein EW026_g6471 [Hermanssonia centrifuga]|uniref:SMP-30/Gluconolactonase/LRE-like region domain-containing protein n=3 Tax=Hermanssonia centrifuga TaxID=98765 RepID=A0A4S4KB78_9APHY|nr:hypothetical protein EW026_g6471 [Hermanssonia centrifuga]
MTNAGTGPYNGSLLLVNSGRGPLPPNLVLVDPANPQNATVILDNFFGRQFNSLHNAKIHPTSGNIFFTDVAYGWLNHFRPLPLLPNQLYRFDPNSGSVRAVADGFVLPNGLAFSQDGSTVFVSDSGMAGGFIGNNQTGPATIYAFDVDPQTESFGNKRVFSYIDGGVPHGLQLDTAGNLYAGTGDGVEVWNSQGTLIGKFFLGSSSSEMLFIGNGRLIILAETKIYMVSLAAEGLDVDYPQGSSSVSEDPSGC